MTLMEEKLERGSRRCDARCYMAKGNDCTCLCGGKNHGVGHEAAMENTRKDGDEMLSTYEAENPGRSFEIKLED